MESWILQTESSQVCERGTNDGEQFQIEVVLEDLAMGNGAL